MPTRFLTYWTIMSAAFLAAFTTAVAPLAAEKFSAKAPGLVA